MCKKGCGSSILQKKCKKKAEKHLLLVPLKTADAIFGQLPALLRGRETFFPKNLVAHCSKASFFVQKFKLLISEFHILNPISWKILNCKVLTNLILSMFAFGAKIQSLSKLNISTELILLVQCALSYNFLDGNSNLPQGAEPSNVSYSCRHGS